MPSDEMVEKARKRLIAMADDPARRVNEFTVMVDLADLRALALSAAHAEPVAWECFRDEAFFDMWCVRPKGERRFGHSFHVTTEEEADGLVALLSASPSEAAIRADERAAKALDLVAKMAGNVVFNGKQRAISHEDHLRAWADIEATAIRARGE